jgi:hypothetical protein
MISHVTKHLAFDEIVPHSNNCGTCGLIGCSIEISTKGRGNSKQDIAKSNCPNFPVKSFKVIRVLTIHAFLNSPRKMNSTG